MSDTDIESGMPLDAIKVVSGNPTDEEIAAVVAVLSAAGSEAAPAPTRSPEPVSRWQRSRRSLRSWSHDERWS